jgi:hypothetical protein
MNRGSRLSGIGSAVRPARRLRKSAYSLSVTLVSPDQAEIDLWKNGKWVRTVMDIEPSDLNESKLDAQGRLKPSTILEGIQSAVQYVEDTYGSTPRTPNKSEIYDADYEEHRHPHPYSKT